MFHVMLAKSAPDTTDTIDKLTGTHYFDLKIDGVRDVIAINKGVVKIQNRNGVDTTYRYPDIVEGCLKQFGPNAQLVLDGEMVAKLNGRPDFQATSQRDRCQEPAKIAARAKSMPATFIAFDILYANGIDYRSCPFHERLRLLDTFLSQTFVPNLVVEGNVGSLDGHAMMALVRKHHLEGVVAKRLDSVYKAGRSDAWLKIKPTFMLSAVVTGLKLGKGVREATFGALNLALYKKDEDGIYVLTSVGDVGTGLKEKDLVEIHNLLHANVYDEALPGDVMVNGHTPNFLVVEVEYQEWTGEALRFPVFRGIRSDVSPDACLYSQTDRIPDVVAS